MNGPQHRLAAVWFADIVDYSRLSAVDEAEAIRLVEIFQSVVKESVEKHDGRVVKFLGDGVLAEFPSTQSAVRAGIDLQKEYTKRTAESPPGDGHSLRVGIHVGDVAQMPDGDLYGDGVNIGARLQEAAGAGQVVISEDVWRQIRQRPEFEFKDLGEQELKGALDPMTIYGVQVGEGLGSRTSAMGIDPGRFSIGRSRGDSHRRWNVPYLKPVVTVAAAVGVTVFLMRGGEEEQPPPPESSTPEAITGQLFEAVGKLQEMQQADEAQQQVIETQRQRLEELQRQQNEQEDAGLPAAPGLAEEMEALRGMLEGLQEMGAPGVVFDSLAAAGIMDSVAAAIEAAGEDTEESAADEDAEVAAPPPPAPQFGPDAQPPRVDDDRQPRGEVPRADRRRPPGQRP
ncbi:MAG: adenylate/guanylate cyclase domain-containing protein [Gemmatimonadetes bacterium]|nr:adenylate/guanylate cyclase domain-containing protein [Gemmatimonadota bacterium]